MLLTITNTQPPATDLGYLLHKHPDRFGEFDLSFGHAQVFYPEARNECCTAALLLEIDPVQLVRGRSWRQMEQYVNDRPYVASSFLSVAIAQVFGSALAGRCKDRPQLATTALPLKAHLSVLPCKRDEAFLRRLFEPLGYTLTLQRHQLDEKFPDWGESFYFSMELQGTVRLCDLLSHLYVLIPVLDDDKHYWVGDDEVDKLLRHGEGWLASHPEREQITKRYLKRQIRLTREALAKLVEDDNPDPDSTEENYALEEAAVEKPLSLNQQRLVAVVAALKNWGAKRVIDLGCGEGKLLKELLKDGSFASIVGVDVSYRALEIAQERLQLDRLPKKQQESIQLIQGSLTYRDKRIIGYDAATVIEVIEHLDPPRLAAFERVLFEFARPGTVVLTTPNFEYNVKFENLPAGKLRHKDHRFEWTRQEFQQWANRVAEGFGYSVVFQTVGTQDPEVGAPTQMAVFNTQGAEF